MNDIASYKPFEHVNFDFKKGVIDLARKQNDTFEGMHTATLIYVNAVEYVGRHLVENLTHINYLITHNELNGIVFHKPIKGGYRKALEGIIRDLECYEFPDKQEFISELKEFKTIRNRILHNLLSLSTDEVQKLDQDFKKIREISEDLLNKYDNLTKGINLIWGHYILNIVSKPQSK